MVRLALYYVYRVEDKIITFTYHGASTALSHQPIGGTESRNAREQCVSFRVWTLLNPWQEAELKRSGEHASSLRSGRKCFPPRTGGGGSVLIGRAQHAAVVGSHSAGCCDSSNRTSPPFQQIREDCPGVRQCVSQRDTLHRIITTNSPVAVANNFHLQGALSLLHKSIPSPSARHCIKWEMCFPAIPPLQNVS